MVADTSIGFANSFERRLLPEDSSIFTSFVVSIEAEALIVGTLEGLIGEVITDEGIGVDLDVVD